MNVLQNKYINKENSGFNVALVPAIIGSVSTVTLILAPVFGFALAFVVVIMAPLAAYGAYHEVARALQNLKASVLTKRTKIIRVQHSIQPMHQYRRRSTALTQ